jgi:3-oxoacyl-[acyl-carrier protein] reductase/2-hydroxycyclohexanecarboxyl-CoA dehydrogenase
LELQNKVALVTGAGSGIGQAIAFRLARAGARIIVNDLDAQSAENTVEEMKDFGAQGLPIQADISNPDEARSMAAEGVKRFQTIDVLVNNAGIGGASILVKDLPPEAWDRVLAVNLKGALNCCQAVIPMMMQRGWGKIVNIASLAASRMSKLGGADYTAAKYGLVGFSRHLAFELAAHKINVNVVCPGATLTPLVESKTTAKFRAVVAGQVPLNRWVLPEDIAEAVLFLSSDRAAMITGVVLDVDGGQLLGIAADYKEDLQRRTDVSAINLKNYLKTNRGKL